MAPPSGSGQEAQVDLLAGDEQSSRFGFHLRRTVGKLDVVALHQLQRDTKGSTAESRSMYRCRAFWSGRAGCEI